MLRRERTGFRSGVWVAILAAMSGKARRRSRLVALVAAFVVPSVPTFAWAAPSGPTLRPAPARATLITRRAAHDDLTAAERVELLAGAVVARPVELERAGGRFVGGVSYQLVRASPPEVLAALADVSRLPELLPRTRDARLIASGDDRQTIELTQGNAVVQATYSVTLVRDGADTLRFWLDDSRPHDVAGVHGFFRVQAFDDAHSLVTVAAVVDLGPGLARLLFERRVQRVVLSAPAHIKAAVEPQAWAQVR